MYFFYLQYCVTIKEIKRVCMPAYLFAGAFFLVSISILFQSLSAFFNLRGCETFWANSPALLYTIQINVGDTISS